MGMFEMSSETAAEYGQKYRELVAPHVNGEEVLAAAAFRRGGASASYVASKAQLGGIVYAAVGLFRKEESGRPAGASDARRHSQAALRLQLQLQGSSFKIKEQVAVWDRAAIKVSTDRSGGMTALTIESPGEGEKATLVGAGIKDDPISQELLGVLQGAAPAAS